MGVIGLCRGYNEPAIKLTAQAGLTNVNNAFPHDRLAVLALYTLLPEVFIAAAIRAGNHLVALCEIKYNT